MHVLMKFIDAEIETISWAEITWQGSRKTIITIVYTLINLTIVIYNYYQTDNY